MRLRTILKKCDYNIFDFSEPLVREDDSLHDAPVREESTVVPK